jgi:CHC2 zinc finger
MMIRVTSDAIATARAVSLANELARRRITLRREGHELVGPCPRCGGSDRFSIHLTKQLWRCRRCPAGGDVIDLVRHLDGVGFAEAVAWLTGGPSTPTQHVASPVRPQPIPPADDGRQAAMVMWHAAGPIAGTLAEHYLVSTRRLELPDDVSPRVLRFHPHCPFGEGTRHPCLVALYRDIRTDEPRAVEWTALNTDGTAIRIDGKTARRMRGSRDAAIKITDDADVAMGLTIGEGVESTLAGMMFDYAPAWALGPAAAIGAFPVLAGIEALTILGERDDGGANERASAACISRWQAAGQDVYRVMPPDGCSDFNDAVTMAA